MDSVRLVSVNLPSDQISPRIVRLNTPLEVPAANHWETVVSCYEAAGLNEDDALLNARMARILTADLWTASTQRPVLWRPDLGGLNDKKRNAEQQVQTQG